MRPLPARSRDSIGIDMRPLAALLLLLPLVCRAQNATTPGEFTTELPTLASLGFEWRISGDDNRNAKVDVTYRKKGEREWRKALPMFFACSVNPSPEAIRATARAITTAYVAPNMLFA